MKHETTRLGTVIILATLLVLGYVGITGLAKNSHSRKIVSEKTKTEAVKDKKNITKSASAPVSPNLGSVFELDGNIAQDGVLDDWATLDAGGGSAIAKTLDSNGQPINIPDPAGTTIFTGGGSKDGLDIPNWRYTGGSVPDKDEILDAFAAAYSVNGELIVVFGADRFAVNGDSQVGLWFFKQAVGLGPNGTFTGQHSVGDILILSHFTQGGGTVNIEVYEWVGSGGDTGGTLQHVASGVNNCAITTSACAITNSSPIASPWAYKAKGMPAGTIPTGGFFEGGVNLTALGISNECFSAFLAETRSSQSVDATLKDFVEGTFTLVPEVSAGPDALITCANPTAQLTASSPLEPNVTFHWTTADGNITSNPDAKTITVDRAGTYTVTITGATGCSNSDSAVVTQDTTPPVANAGPDATLTCSITSVQLNGQTDVANPVYQWSTLDGHIVGASNGASITADKAGTYTLMVTNPVNGCGASDSAVVNANVAPPSVQFSKTSADGNALSVLLTTVASSNSVPAGTLSYQYQTCVLNCNLDASWTNAGANQTTFVFSNFGLVSPAAQSFSIGSDNYSGQLFVVNTRVKVSDAGNGCSTTSSPALVKKVTAVDP